MARPLPDRLACLDYAATTPVRPEAVEAMAPLAQNVFGNPSGVHEIARRAKTVLEEAREQVASDLGCEPREVVFTGGGSEADNLAVKGAAWAAREQNRGDHVVTTAFEHHAVLDPGYSIDVTPLAGAAFLGDTLALLATNKSIVLLRPTPDADADREWRHFLRTDGSLSELRLGRFATQRARQMYVMSLAYDAAADELVTVAVPSPRHRRLVVARFSRADFLPVSERVPVLGAGLAMSAPERSLGEFLVTGAAVADGALYAISAAYSTLLVMDPEGRMVRAAYLVPGLAQPTGLAARGSRLLVAQADGRIAVLDRPRPAPERRSP